MYTRFLIWGRKIYQWGLSRLSLLFLIVLTLIVTIFLFKEGLLSLASIDEPVTVPAWRSYLGRTEDRIKKTLLLPDLFQSQSWNLSIFMSAASWQDYTYNLIIIADGVVVYRFDSPPDYMRGWQNILISQEILSLYQNKTQVDIELRVIGQPDTELNYVNVYGVDIVSSSSGGSFFNGSSEDLSPDPGQQQGDFLIRLIPTRHVPPLPSILAFSLLPVLVYTLLALHVNRNWAAVGGGGILLALTIIVWFWYDQTVSITPIVAYIGCILLLISWVWSVRQGHSVINHSPVIWLTLMVILLWGVSQYWVMLSNMADRILEPDAANYRIWSEKVNLFSESGFYSASFGPREPMWPSILRLAFNLLGNSDFTLRLTSLFFTATVIIATYCLGTVLLDSPWAGLFAALLVSVDPLWVAESVRGLREPLYTTLWLLFCLLCFGLRDGPRFYGFKRTILTGIVGGLLLLTRPNGATLLGVILLMPLLSYGRRFVKQKSAPIMPRWTLSMSLVALLIAITLYAPHLYGMYKRHGDPFWPTRGYARWLANMEFQDRIGAPGFPPAEEFAKSGYAGPPLSYGEYLFELHTLSELIKGTIQGYFQILKNVTDGVPLAIIYLAALPLFILDQRRLPLLFVIFFQIAPVAFLYSRPGLIERHRHIIDIEPLAIIAAVYVLMCLYRVLVRGELKGLLAWGNNRA